MSALPHEAMPAPLPERTLDLFWKTWGEKCDIPRGRLNLMWNHAERHYEDELDQHNFDHAVDVLWAGMELADMCEENDEPVNRRLLTAALLYHDAGYHLDHTSLFYTTKEELAAKLWGDDAPAFLYDEEEINAVKTLIEATGPGFELKEPLKLEQKIMIRADLHNVGEDYASGFTPTTLRLLKEEIRRCERLGKKINAGDFAFKSVGILRAYLKNDLSLGPFEPNDWQRAATSNVTRLAGSLAREANSSRKNIYELGTEAVKRVLGSSED